MFIFSLQQEQSRRIRPRSTGGWLRHSQRPEILAHQELLVEPMGQRWIRPHVQ